MQDENKKALVYLGIAIAVVVGWLLINKQYVPKEVDTRNTIQEDTKKPTDEKPVADSDSDDEDDGKGGLAGQQNGNTRLKKWTVVKNEALGFSVNLPAGWYIPDANDTDPHFYSCGYYECPMAFEVQRTDTLADKGFAQVMEEAKAEQLRPKQVYLIPGAKVIKSDAPMNAEGWNDQYLVIFEKDHVGFTVYLNGWRAERLVLPTLKLVK